MASLKQRWKSIPVTIRKPVVLIIGLLIVIASPFTGVLPGPGGIPMFLLGVAILASEYAWAQRIRDPILRVVERAIVLWRRRRIIGTLIIVAVGLTFGGLSYLLYSKL